MSTPTHSLSFDRPAERLLRLGVWLLFFSVFSSASGIGLATVLIGVFGLRLFWPRLREAPGLPLFWPIVALVGAVGLSILFATGSGYAKPFLKMKYFGVYFLLVLAFSRFPELRGRIARAGIFLSVLLAVVSLLQFFGLFDPLIGLHITHDWLSPYEAAVGPNGIPVARSHFFHARGLLYHHNPFGYGALLLFHLMLGQAIHETDRRWKAGYVAGSLACLIGVLASGSRGAWLGLAISMAVVLLSMGRKYWRWFAGVLVAATLVAALLGGALKGRFESMRPSENQERIRLWTICVQLFERSPLVGVGYHRGFELNREPYMTAAELRSGTFPTDPHSVYFDLLATTGLLGLVAFLWWLGAGLGLYLSTLGQGGVLPKERGMLLAGLGAWVSFAVGSAFDSHFFHTETLNGTLFFLGLGQSVVLQYQASRRKRSDSKGCLPWNWHRALSS